MRCHPVFHVDRLQPYYESDSNAFPNRIQPNRPKPPIEALDAEWVVETILDRCWRETGNKNTKGYRCWREWLVKWQRYDDVDSNSWGRQSAFVSVNKVFLNYELRNPYSAEEMEWIKKYDKSMY